MPGAGGVRPICSSVRSDGRGGSAGVETISSRCTPETSGLTAAGRSGDTRSTVYPSGDRSENNTHQRLPSDLRTIARAKHAALGALRDPHDVAIEPGGDDRCGAELDPPQPFAGREVDADQLVPVGAR